MANKLTLAEWQERASQVQFNGRAFINGEYCDAADGETFPSINPATGDALGEVSSCDKADADIAVEVARRAFKSGSWAEPAVRKKVLLKLAQLISQHREELALLETLDMGKGISDSFNVDIPSAAACVRWNAEAIDKVYGEVAPTSASKLGIVVREPLGVVAAIVPWNFPLLMACWKIAPALAAGNAVILKPSEKSPLTAIRLAGLAQQAGVPDGIFQVLPGFGHTVGKALALHMDVNAIAFTGSTNVGKQLIQYAGQSNMKRTFMECGGKSPNIVCADAENLDRVAKAAASAIFYNQGEVCIAASRLLVENSIKDTFIEKVMSHAGKFQPGNPLDPASRMGAIVDDLQLDRVLGYIGKGCEEGASLKLGGQQLDSEAGGYFIGPTVFDDVTPQMTIAKEEIFGPVLTVIGFDTLEEAIEIANDTVYGLAAAVWTANINKALKASRTLESGQVFINNYGGGDMSVPFGGMKQSGNGRDKSIHSLKEYSELKTIWIEIQ